MEKISIKLDILGIVIPMTILKEDEEQIRKIAKKINEKAAQVRSNYAIQEVATILAMVCLQMAIEQKQVQEDKNEKVLIVKELAQIQKALEQLV